MRSEHLKKYAKAYSGGISAGGIGPAAATIVLWLIGLTGVEVPAEVKGAIDCLVAAVVTGAVVALVGPNVDINADINADIPPADADADIKEKEPERIDWVKRIRGR